MQIGSLGDIVFTVSDSTVRTFTNFVYSGSAQYSTHQRHVSSALTEFVGVDPEQITFDIILNAYLGVTPSSDLKTLQKYERNGTVLSLVIGDTTYGQYRWNLLSHSLTASHFDKSGDITVATVSITLQEYLKS
ncbi:MAG: phage tail protein [Coriobacteriaceae bacterium]|nr:phage tail protein [Coriobacteriaceae bacterium]